MSTAAWELASASGDPRILLVDDDERRLAALALLLEPLAAELVCARSGAQALAELAAAEFAVVLLDLGIAGIDGFETARLVKERASTPDLPIVFLTGRISEEELRRGYSLGAIDYLLKPFDPQILRSRVGVFVELARLRSQTEILSYRVLHDPLTGLPNRTLFFDRLEVALARLTRDPALLAVLFLDLDGFKQINDTYGHQAGDRVLVETATRLQTTIRAVDTAARFGGDEFLILCEQLPDQAEIEQLTDRLTTAIEQPIPLPEGEILPRAAIGNASTNDAATPAQELIRAADEAMRRAKPTARRHNGLIS